MTTILCTNRSLVAGGIEIERECIICFKVSKHTDGYIGSVCHSCGTLVSGEEFRGHIALLQRMHAGLTRKQLGAKIRYTPKTIKQYEFVSCTDKYWNKLQKFLRSQL